MNKAERIWEPFLDWHGIWPGATGYEEDGRAWVSDSPQGVKLSVQQAEKSEPVMVIDKPWEGGNLGYSNVIYEDGHFRLWYMVGGAEGEGGLCYAESADGLHWEKPNLGLYERNGSKANNIVYHKGIQGSVFRDPSASEAERYKLVDMQAYARYRGRVVRGTEMARVRRELEEKGLTGAEIFGRELQLLGEVLGAVSPDGLRWTRIEEPLFDKFCDTQNVAFYDEELGRYVGYWRTSVGNRRAIARSETDDFRHWPLPDTVLAPDSQEPPSDDYYTNAYSRYPGGGRRHLMFPAIYYRTSDVLNVRLAVSGDGLNWTWPERVPIIPLGPDGSGESGGIYAAPGLFSLGQDRWGLLLQCRDKRHNERKHAPGTDKCHYSWAMWKRDRLVALEASTEGQLTLSRRGASEALTEGQVNLSRPGPRGPSKGLILDGGKMLLNYKTARNGWIRVELIEPTLWPAAHIEPLKGYSFEECEPLRGDSLDGEVKWNGSGDLSAFKGRTLAVRIQMCQAELFAYQV